MSVTKFSVWTRILTIAFGTSAVIAAVAASAESFIRDANAVPAKTVVKTAFAPQEKSAPAAPAANLDEAIIFTAPPRESAEAGKAMYAPVAAYLSKIVGKKIRYVHPGTWGAYRSEMLKGSYDLVFDGPHFNGYRAERLNHNVLVKMPNALDFAIIVRKEERFTTAAQMGGRKFCSQAPPNLGALMLLSQFDNPARQPAIIPKNTWDEIYAGVVSGECNGGVMPISFLNKLDKNGLMKAVYKTQGMPNQAFSAGPRLSLEDQQKIASALMSQDGAQSMEKMRSAFKIEKFVAANNSEYIPAAQFLRSEWGYY
jgi:ABC-type phosphate/phosphonate transport system substrate-binding protein